MQDRPIEIAIIRTSSIGDVVLASAAIDYLNIVTKLTGKQFKINWIGRTPSADLLDKSHSNVQMIYAPAEKPSEEIINKIRNSLFLIDLQVTPRTRKLCSIFRKWTKRKSYAITKYRFERIEMVLKAYFRGRKRDLTPKELVPREKQYETAAKIVARALLEHEIIDIKTAEKYISARPTLSTSNLKSEKIFWNRMKEGQWIAIAAGASFDTKKTPKLVITEVLMRLRESLFDVELPRLVFLGDRNDKEITKTIIEEIDWPEMTLDLTGQTSLYETLGVLSKVKTVLSNDSSLPHLAESIGVDSAVLFGPTTEAFGFSPHRPTSKVFSVPIGCRPCSKHGKKPCRFEDKQCFYEIDRKEITDF